MSILGTIRDLFDLSSPKPAQPGPFDQYRYPHFVVRVPEGKRAPRQCVISAADGVDEFTKIFPYASPEEIATVRCAFDMGASAIQILTAH